ncbi:MAG: DUF488 domain-containing protein [Candidatus Dormibacteria bacterium]
MSEIRLRRVYEPPLPRDGARVLVDRLWPRGVSKEEAHLDRWLKEVAPSHELRRWYGHVVERFPEFRARYLAELDAPERGAAMAELKAIARVGVLTLLTGTRDVVHSQGEVLLELLRRTAASNWTGEEGGDAACWQKRVCPNCGTLAETNPPTICQRCCHEIAG